MHFQTPRHVEEFTDDMLYSPGRSAFSAHMSDTLDFAESAANRTHVRSKAEAEVLTPLEQAVTMNPKFESPLTRPVQGASGYQKWLSTEDKKSLQNLLAMDLELATAVRLSLVESQAKAAREKQEYETLLSQIKSWDNEIQRLKDWSEAFEVSLGAQPSEAETMKQYSIFEQLAKIGSAFSTLTIFLVFANFCLLPVLYSREHHLILSQRRRINYLSSKCHGAEQEKLERCEHREE
jgi:hypothetical protein